MTSTETERTFERSVANDPRPLREWGTWEILREIRNGGDAAWMSALSIEILTRCNDYERIR